jgi:hypothetical protein
MLSSSNNWTGDDGAAGHMYRRVAALMELLAPKAQF